MEGTQFIPEPVPVDVSERQESVEVIEELV